MTVGLARVVNARPGDDRRLRHALAQATPAATGVPERALLVIRKLRADIPFTSASDAFAAAVIASIRTRKATARRGGAMTDTDDIYFDDEDDLDVALVMLTLAGDRLPAALAAALPDLATPLTRWRRQVLRDPRRLPVIVARLVRNGVAAAWLARFDDHEMTQAAGLILRNAGAPDLAEIRASPRATNYHDGPAASRSRLAVPETVRRAVAIAGDGGTRTSIRVLLAVATLAVERPDMLATQAFARELRTLLNDTTVVLLDHPEAAPVRTEDGPAPRPMARYDRPGGTPRPLAAGDRPSPYQMPAGLRSIAVPQRPALSGEASEAAYGENVLFAESAGIASDHAGLFFLLSVFSALGLYGDFADPRSRIPGLSPFELLLLLGRRWFGGDFERDPLARLLRSLAGIGPSAQIGRHFEAPVWHVPPEWLAPWPDQHVRVNRGSHWHQAGFPIDDNSAVSRTAAARRRRWVDSLARYLAARLARALGTTDRHHAVGMVGRRRGRVEVAGTHISVVFALDTHPIELRLAGLDRDIGWLPAAGHSIRFVFR